MLYSFAGITVPGSCKHTWKFSFNLVGVFHEIYIIQLSGRYENVLKEMRRNNDYLILGLEAQYVGN